MYPGGGDSDETSKEKRCNLVLPIPTWAAPVWKRVELESLPTKNAIPLFTYESVRKRFQLSEDIQDNFTLQSL